MDLEHQELTGAIIGAAVRVHRALGPGFVELAYENALAIELTRSAIPFERQLTLSVFYEGVEVAVHRLDLLVASEIVVELKAVRHVDDVHRAIVRSYLRASGRTHALLLNFGRDVLETRRLIERPLPRLPVSSPPRLS